MKSLVVHFLLSAVLALPLRAAAAQDAATLLRDTSSAATVLLFISVDCPISNKYAPEMARLIEKYSPKGVRFWFVYPDSDTTFEAALNHAREYSLGTNVVCDPKHLLVKRAHAKVTPEAAVFDIRHRLVYSGRIDDRFPTLGQARNAATRHDLENALDQLLAEKPVEVSATKAVGCRISGT